MPLSPAEIPSTAEGPKTRPPGTGGQGTLPALKAHHQFMRAYRTSRDRSYSLHLTDEETGAPYEVETLTKASQNSGQWQIGLSLSLGLPNML